MVVTLLNGIDQRGKSILAVNLAAWRMRESRKVLLIDADMHKNAFLWSIRRSTARTKPHLTVLPILDESLYSELENLDSRYQDMVIDAGDLDAADTKTALVAAQIAAVPLRMHTRDLNAENKLIRCIERAKPFNPTLRTLLVIVHGSHGDVAAEVSAARALAKEIPSAMVACTILHDRISNHVGFDHGQTVFENHAADERSVIEINEIGREVFGDSVRPERIFANVKAAGSFLKRRTRRHEFHQQR